MNDYKNIKFSDDVYRELLIGVDTLANTVKITIGPKGKNVILEQPSGLPLVTKDGITVAKAINLKDRFKNLGVQLVKEASSKTNDVAGDGTTTATVLTQAIFTEGLKMISAGFSVVELNSGIKKAIECVKTYITDISVKIKGKNDIINVGTISSNGDKEIGGLIAEAMHEVGNDGMIYVDESTGFKTHLDILKGMKFDRGYISPYFVTDANRMTCELDNPYVLISNKPFNIINDLLHILETVAKENRSILIIADEVEGEALQALVVNKQRGNLKICAVRSPGFGTHRHDLLSDIALFTGGQVILDDSDLKDTSYLGNCSKVLIDKNSLTIVSNDKSKVEVENKVKSLKQNLDDETLLSEEKQKIKERISKLLGVIAVLKVGALTEIELNEKKDRIDDALCATKAAVDEGIVPGGGTLYLKSIKALDKLKESKDLSIGEISGINIVRAALQAPFKQILNNASIEPGIRLNEIIESKNANYGINAATGEYCDLINNGIVDPAKVCRVALENASSIAMMLLSVDSAVVYDNDYEA